MHIIAWVWKINGKAIRYHVCSFRLFHLERPSKDLRVLGQDTSMDTTCLRFGFPSSNHNLGSCSALTRSRYRPNRFSWSAFWDGSILFRGTAFYVWFQNIPMVIGTMQVQDLRGFKQRSSPWGLSRRETPTIHGISKSALSSQSPTCRGRI